MAMTSTTLTGPIYMPDGATPIGGRVSFELTSWDKEVGEAVFVSGPYIADIESDGSISVSLFTTTEGTNSAVYRMSVQYTDADGVFHNQYFGYFALSGPGPYSLSTLTIYSEFTTSTFDVLATVESATTTTGTNASAAAASATTATTKASEAASSASTASTKAGEASSSATTASTKASEASTSKDTATTKASEASTSAGGAAASASTATSQAGIATTKATEAASSASAASTSASGASTSASTATTKASEASTSATEAAASASAASSGNQPLDSGLTSLAGLTTGADKLPYTTAHDVYSTTTLTAAGRTLLGDADAQTQLATLGATPLAGGALSGGITSSVGDDGTKSSGTYTPTTTDENFKKIVGNGAFTLAAPTDATGYSLAILITNGASAGSITFSGFEAVTGDTVSTTNAEDFMLYITSIESFAHAHVVALQ